MKILKKISTACILCVLLLCLFLAGVKIYLGTDHARHLILTEINKTIPGTITWRENRISFLEGGVDLKNVLLKGPAGDLLAAIERVRADISWLDLMTGSLTFESALLEKPQVTLEEEADGTLNLLKAFGGNEENESSGTGLPFNIIVRKALISGGSIEYRLNADDRIVLPGIDMELRNGNFLKQEAKLFLRLTNTELIMGERKTGFESIVIRGIFVKDRVEQLQAAVKTSGNSTLTVEGQIRNLFGQLHPELGLSLEGDLADILKTALLDADITGGVSAHLKLRGPLNRLEGALDLKYMGGELAGNRIDHSDIACRLEKRVVLVDRAFVKSPYGESHLKGDINFQQAFPDGFFASRRDPDAAFYKFSITQKGMKFEKIPGVPEGVTGRGQAKAAVTGKGLSLSSLAATLSIEAAAEKLRVEEIFESRETSFLRANADIEKSSITVKHFELNSGKNRMRAEGEYDLQSMEINGNLSVSAKLPAPELLVAEAWNAQGSLDLNLRISGKAGKPVIKGDLKGDGLGYHEVNLGDLTGEMFFSGGMISFDRLTVRQLASGLDFSGSVQLFDPQTNQTLEDPPIDVCVSGEKIFLEEFFTGMKGEVSLQGGLAGSVSFPFGEIHLSGRDIDLGMQKIPVLEFKSHLDGDRLFMDEYRAGFSDGEEVQAGGWISLDGHYDVHAASDGISLNHIDRIADQDWTTESLFFDFQGAGSFEDPALSGKIGLKGLQLNEKPIDPFSLKVDVSDWTARIEGEKERSIHAELNLKTSDIKGEARTDRLDLAPWFKFAGYDELDGFLEGRVDVSGNLNVLDQVRMKAQLSRVEIFWQQKELLQASDISITLADGTLEIPEKRLSLLKEGYLDAGGQAQLNGRLDFKANGKVPIRVAELFLDEISETKGVISCSASVGGSLEKPYVDAALNFEKVGLEVSYFSERLQDVSGKLHFTSDRITAENVKGKFVSGGFNLEGMAALKQYQPDSIRLKLTAHAVPLVFGDQTELLLNTNLEFQGTQASSTATGDIVILEGLYTRDVNLNPLELVVSQSRDEKPVSEKKAASFFDNTVFDVVFQNRNPFVIDNNIALLLLRPDFHFQGTLERPMISGRAKAESGIIRYQGKEFEVTRGIVDFINPYRIEPSIELEGRTQVREWTVFLDVKGTVENLRFGLRSDPPEQEGDILYLLVFGKTLREFIDGEGGKSSNPKVLLAGLMADRIQSDLKEATGLDTVQFQYTSSDGESETGQVSVEVGKDLSRQVAVKYGIETRNSRLVRRTVTEYRLFKNFMLDAYQDSEGDYGGGMRYRIEFR